MNIFSKVIVYITTGGTTINDHWLVWNDINDKLTSKYLHVFLLHENIDIKKYVILKMICMKYQRIINR